MIGASLARVLARPGMGGVTYRHIKAMLAEGLVQRWKAADGSVVVTEVLEGYHEISAVFERSL